jgi:hydrogenase maturation protease
MNDGEQTMNGRPEFLLLALGNDLLGDDGVGLAAAREIARSAPEGVEIVEAATGGFALMDLLEGYAGAVIVDAVATGTCPPWTVREVRPEEFADLAPASPHYTGLPSLLQLASLLGIRMPADLRIIAMEVEDPYELREGLSPGARAALPCLVNRTREALAAMTADAAPAV